MTWAKNLQGNLFEFDGPTVAKLLEWVTDVLYVLQRCRTSYRQIKEKVNWHVWSMSGSRRRHAEHNQNIGSLDVTTHQHMLSRIEAAGGCGRCMLYRRHSFSCLYDSRSHRRSKEGGCWIIYWICLMNIFLWYTQYWEQTNKQQLFGFDIHTRMYSFNSHQE